MGSEKNISASSLLKYQIWIRFLWKIKSESDSSKKSNRDPTLQKNRTLVWPLTKARSISALHKPESGSTTFDSQSMHLGFKRKDCTQIVRLQRLRCNKASKKKNTWKITLVFKNIPFLLFFFVFINICVLNFVQKNPQILFLYILLYAQFFPRFLVNIHSFTKHCFPEITKHFLLTTG